MLTEVKYRTFNELLDSVRVDLKSIDLEGAIEPAELIKIAAKINYELGLKVNPARSKVIEIIGGKTRLPADFYVLNFALLLKDKRLTQFPYGSIPIYKTYCQGIADGVELSEDLINNTMSNILYTETLNIEPGSNLITHDLNTTDFIVQATSTTGSQLEFNFNIINNNVIDILSEAEVTLSNIKVVLMSGNPSDYIRNLFFELNLCNNGTVTEPCSNTTTCSELITTNGSSKVCCTDSVTNEMCEYDTLIPLKIDKTKTLSADSFNIMTRSRYTGMLKNNFFVTNFDYGDVYINYQSLMEDDNGNLLVMFHDTVNEFYEYAFKERIFENLYLNGDNTMLQRLQFVQGKLQMARNNALSFVNTPDFNDLRKTWEMNRKAQYSQFYDMFKDYPVINPTL